MEAEEIQTETDVTALLTVNETLTHLRISRATLYKLFREHRLRKRRLFGRTLVARSDLEAFVASLGEAA